jgi:hypothetical protein
MSSIGRNQRRKFIDGKIREAFGDRNMNVDQMIEDLAREGRTTSVF